jgi:hypothetical protein
MEALVIEKIITCYHCGEDCRTDKIVSEDKFFCCDGCKNGLPATQQARSLRLLLSQCAPVHQPLVLLFYLYLRFIEIISARRSFERL